MTVQDKTQLSSRPPSSPGTQDMDDFIAGAGTRTVDEVTPQAPQHEATQEPYPWESPGVRENITKVYNLRFPEPYLLKLKYIAEHTPASMQAFCLDLLLPEIDKKIEELITVLVESPARSQ